LVFAFWSVNAQAWAGGGWGTPCTPTSPPSNSLQCSAAFPICGFGPANIFGRNLCYCDNTTNTCCFVYEPVFRPQSYANDLCSLGGSNYQCPSDPTQSGYCDNTTKRCQIVGSPLCQATMIDGSSATIPVPSAVSLIFAAFFVGIVVSYVVYKCRKSPNKYDNDAVRLESSTRTTAEDSQIGDKRLTHSPLSEQVWKVEAK